MFKNKPTKDPLKIFKEIRTAKVVYKHLNNLDLSNLYEAIKNNKEIKNVFCTAAFFFKLEISEPWFAGNEALDYFNKVISVVIPKRLIFSESSSLLCPSAALKFLRLIVSKNKQKKNDDKVHELEELDCTGILVTEQFLKFVSDNFVLKKLILRESRQLSPNIVMSDLTDLTVKQND